MADTFPLPPDADDFVLTVTLHRQAMPYVTDWYQDKKRTGENPQQFLRRLIYKAALNHRISKISGQLDVERLTTEQSTMSDREIAEGEYATTLETVESL